MSTKDKELLIKDLCARLPYNCRVFYEYIDDLDGKTYGYSLTLNTWCIDEFVANKAVIKPYLRPLSSMTKEEWNDYKSTWKLVEHDLEDTYEPCIESFDWLNEHHFDFRNLIERGLAIDCTNLNIY